MKWWAKVLLRKKGSVHFELSTARLLDGELPITLSPSFPAIRNSFKTEAIDSTHLPFSSVYVDPGNVRPLKLANLSAPT